MKVALVAPTPSNGAWGGAQRAVAGLQRAIAVERDAEVDLATLAVDESTLPGLIDAYDRFHRLDVSAYDRVVSVKYPGWMVDHPHHVVYLFHPLRGLYDAYEAFGLPLGAPPLEPTVGDLLDFITGSSAQHLDEFFERFRAVVDHVGPDAPDLALVGPTARAIVHWLDRIAMAPERIHRYGAISSTVAGRSEYFPAGITPIVVPLPADVGTPIDRARTGRHLFTASRLDAPKRIDLIIAAMAYVGADVPLYVAGVGPEFERLRRLGAHDPRIEFLGRVDDDRLVELYRDAIAVPFVPFDEDQGLITLEAAAHGTPTVTCFDSGGPVEFVHDGVNGLVVEATAAALGRGLDRLTRDPEWARSLGQRAKIDSDRVTWSRVVDALFDPLADRRVGGEAPARSRRSRRRRAVVLGNAPIDHPRSGGELRSGRMSRALAEGMETTFVAVVSEGSPASETVLSTSVTQKIVRQSAARGALVDDIGRIAGIPVPDILAASDDDAIADVLDAVAAHVRTADVVIVEHPYLYPIIERLGIDVPVVVNTHNVEIDLKAAVLAPSTVTEDLLARVRRVEGAAVQGADLVTACSDDDARRLGTSYGRDVESIVVFPNGTDLPDRGVFGAERRRLRRRWFERFRWGWGTPLPRRLAVFVGSWHPPNIDAAEFLLELAVESPDLMICSVGGHGGAFAARDLPDNIMFPGVVSTAAKSALFSAADVAVNPMRVGSGTNLKLVEFFGHGVPVVSTPYGARGFGAEDRVHLLLAEPGHFAEAVDEVLADPDAAEARARAARDLAGSYDWASIGAGYRALVSALIDG